MYSYLTDNVCVDKNAKGTIKSVIKWEIKLQDFKRCLENNKKIFEPQQRFWSEAHDLFGERVNKIDLEQMLIRECEHPIE